METTLTSKDSRINAELKELDGLYTKVLKVLSVIGEHEECIMDDDFRTQMAAESVWDSRNSILALIDELEQQGEED